jgi:diguanylate cyclase (GGDEF)-like protein/PAS domain S-box-containing protein
MKQETKLRKDAIAMLSDQGKPDISALDTDEIANTLHELQVHQIELEMQNEELQRVQETLERSRDRYANLYDFAPMGLCTLDSNGIITQANHTLSDILGIERNKLLNTPLVRHVHKEDASILLHRLKHPGHTETVDLHMQNSSESDLYARMTILPMPPREYDKTGGALLLSISDISDSHNMAVELEIKSRAMEKTLEGIMISGADNKICYVNPAFEKTTGYKREEVIGKEPSILQSGRHDQAFYREMWHSLAIAGFWKGEIWNRRRNGDIYPEWLSVSVITDKNDKPSYYVGVFSDITTQEEIRQRLHSLAYYDAITDLPNRHLFFDRINQAIKEASREQGEFAVLFMDLDRFKSINDALGHTVGDQLLVEVAERLRRILREMDTISRMGGDEFLILLPRIKSNEESLLVARKILNAISLPFDLGGRQYHITISIGISHYPGDGSDPDALIKNADIAMYKAKGNGRNTYYLFNQKLNEQLVEHLDLENDLRNAVNHDLLDLYYQPQVELRNGKWKGIEALLRWEHPELGYIPPDKFIAVAEETGLIIKIGYWVIYRACRQYLQLKDMGHVVGRMALNLSPHQFLQSNLVEKIKEILSETGMSPHDLELELTESAAMPNLEYSIKTLQALQDMGVNISIDDFGTGFSSLSHLQKMPIDTIKIDRSFVMDTPGDPDDMAIVEAIIAMAKSLNLNIVAEGIETQQQLDYLHQAGCHIGQGYLLFKPLNFADLTRLLESRKST